MPGSPVFGSPQAGSPIRVVNPPTLTLNSPAVNSERFGPSLLGSPTQQLVAYPQNPDNTQVIYSAPFGNQVNAGGSTIQLVKTPESENLTTVDDRTFNFPSF